MTVESFFSQRVILFSKNIMRWCLELVDFYVPHTIQPQEYSRGGGTDGSRHKVFAVNVNWNSDNRKWNVNDWKLDENGNWNTDNQVLCPGHA